MKKYISTAFPLFLLLVCGNVFSTDFALFKGGKPVAAILKDDPRTFKDLEWFNTAIKRCSGHVMPLAAENQKMHGNVIRIKIEKKPITSDDEYSITFPDPKTMLITATGQSLPAALSFILEESFGCRFLFPPLKGLISEEDGIFYPVCRNAALPMREIRKTASFNLNREPSWLNGNWTRKYWNYKRAVVPSHGLVHYAFPVYKYAADQSWPREMLPVLNGKKYVPHKAKAPLSKNIFLASRGYQGHWQPCFSHPKTAEIAAANILEYLDRHPGTHSISLGINDDGGMCECDNCKKAVGNKRNSVGQPHYSPLYWRWVNNVVETVTKKYPDVLFPCLAYREVMDPPDFKLHANVLPGLCFELTAMNDPVIQAKREKILQGWEKIADRLECWDYAYGPTFYVFPRIYFKSHSKWLEKLYHQYKLKGIYHESRNQMPFEGPKFYLMAKKTYDIQTDPEKIVMEWITAAVGKKSAPYLRQYYQFWEDYWNGEEIKKTSWYNSRFSIYMHLGEMSHASALKKGDMKKLRNLMEKVVANAETPDQKKRAEILLRIFELSEDAATALFAEQIPPDGQIKDAATAAEVLQQLPAAMKAYERLLRNPFTGPGKEGTYTRYFRTAGIQPAQFSYVSQTFPFAGDPKVRKEMSDLADSAETPLILRGMLKVMLGAKPANLLNNGSFEKDAPMPHPMWGKFNGFRTSELASEGKYSFRLPRISYYAYRIPVQAGKTYLFLYDVFSKKVSVEGKWNYARSPYRGNIAQQHFRYLNLRLESGKWNLFANVCKAWEKTDTIVFLFYPKDFEKDDELFIDNIRVYCLDDLIR